jgi:hypothetical protein
MILKRIKVQLNDKEKSYEGEYSHMNIQGVNISSILIPEVKYIVLTKRFVSSLAEEYPAFISYNEDKVKLRELILLKKKLITGYKYDVNVKEGDGGLSSLYDDDEIVLNIRARKNGLMITSDLVFLGIKKKEMDKILIIHDLPVIARDRNGLIEGIREFLRSWNGIEIETIPTKFKLEYKHKVKAKIIDVDYADVLFTP